MIAELEARKNDIVKLCARYPIERLAVFGSAVRGDFLAGKSDIDFLVRIKPCDPQSYAETYFSLHSDLEKLLATDIDLITESSIKNPYILQSIRDAEQEIYVKQWLQSIPTWRLESIPRIERFTAGKTYESYIADELLQSAVERQLSIIGEAIAKLNRVDPTLGDRLLDSPQIIAFRNRLIHNYGQVDHAIVWGVISSKISLLRDRASTLLAG